jgi:hypothetical protein
MVPAIETALTASTTTQSSASIVFFGLDLVETYCAIEYILLGQKLVKGPTLSRAAEHFLKFDTFQMNAIQQYRDLKRRIDDAKSGSYVDLAREMALSKLLAMSPNRIFKSSASFYCLYRSTLWIDNENMGLLHHVDWDAVIKKATPAPFGHGEETKLDPTVRDALEIPASRFQFKWESSGEEVANWHELNLPELEIKTVRPYKLQIYKVGGHFKPHRDTIHSKDHMATQIMFMPSHFEGGDLVVRRDGREFRTSSGMCLFYTDCEHEVEPVTEGIRVTLQLDVFGRSKTVDNPTVSGFGSSSSDDEEVPTSRIEGLEKALDEYWEEHDNVSFLLRHDYTQETLDVNQLRGFDATLFNSLKALDYEPALHFCILHRVFDEEEDEEVECSVLDSSLKPVPYSGSNVFIPCAPPMPLQELEMKRGDYLGNESAKSSTTYCSACLLVSNSKKHKEETDKQVDKEEQTTGKQVESDN